MKKVSKRRAQIDSRNRYIRNTILQLKRIIDGLDGNIPHEVKKRRYTSSFSLVQK